MSKENGGAAFPMKGMETRNGQGIEQIYERGMTLRDYFATGIASEVFAITSRFFSMPDGSVHLYTQDYSQTAQQAYLLADAMLAERSK